MDTLKKTIIYISSNYSAGEQTLEKTFQELTLLGKIKMVSSIYKKTTPNTQTLELAVLFHTWGEPETLSESLKKIQTGANLQIVIFESITLLSPLLTLPHPRLYQDGVMARCCAEVWSNYIHPLYNETLGVVAKKLPSGNQVEYYKQGKVVFNELP